MCQSQAEGGQRCSAHTRPCYLHVLTAIQSQRSSSGINSCLNNDERDNLTSVTCSHATTVLGAREIQDEIRSLQMILSGRVALEDNAITDLLEILSFCLIKGASQREINKSVKENIALARGLEYTPDLILELKKREDVEFLEHNTVMLQIILNFKESLKRFNDEEENSLESIRREANVQRRSELKRYEKVSHETERLKVSLGLSQPESKIFKVSRRA